VNHSVVIRPLPPPPPPFSTSTPHAHTHAHTHTHTHAHRHTHTHTHIHTHTHTHTHTQTHSTFNFCRYRSPYTLSPTESRDVAVKTLPMRKAGLSRGWDESDEVLLLLEALVTAQFRHRYVTYTIHNPVQACRSNDLHCIRTQTPHAACRHVQSVTHATCSDLQ
jgi:hypothetical protein